MDSGQARNDELFKVALKLPRKPYKGKRVINKGEVMKRSTRILYCALVALLGGLVLQGQPAWAAQARYELTGVQIGAFVTIDDDIQNQIRFTIEVNELLSFTGDIRGLFFDIAPFPTGLTASDFSGPEITDIRIADNAVTSTSQGNSIDPYGPFDVGVEFGTAGIGHDDIQGTVFQIVYSGGLGLDAFTFEGQQIGLRLTSVGYPEGERATSSKMFLLVEDGGSPPSAVPVPSSFLLMGAGLLGLIGGARRK
jgi:hypothetical protein